VPSLLALFARTWLIGVAVAAPVGPLGMLCIQRTLARGWRAGLATGLGIATGDGTYAALAAFGLAALASALVAWQMPLRLIGGAALILLGARSMLARSAATPPAETPGHAGAYLSAVGLTLTNPLTIMAFAAVFASAGLVAQPGWGSALAATLGVASGSLSWWLALTTGMTLARRSAGGRLVSAVSRVSGGVIAAFGVAAIVSAFVR
jgi:putative LysE/RhtB family amino acid efflux pump